ncbi:MAG: FAD-dependent oxidoreductase [Clostridia bacterium]|nr:FAD-dependent oxidoreductase [Clostridia bacterium]
MLTNKNYEIAVCGGGFAGVSAALSASRLGKKVVLFEKEYMLGGLGTAGLITIYLPICDGLGKQVSFGIAEELLKLSIKYGYEDLYPDNWLDGVGTKTEKDKRYEVQYNPQVCAILMEKLLIENGVDIMYGSYVIDAEVLNGKIDNLTVVNKSGQTKYYIKSVVDATGDCDVAKFSSAPTEEYEQKNVLAAWYYSIVDGKYDLHKRGLADLPKEELVGRPPVKHLVDKRFSGLDGEELSEMVTLSHNEIFNNFLNKRKSDKDFIVTMPTIPLVRMTRKIVGEYTLKYNEMHTYFEDSIGMVSNWKVRGPIYEVPFTTLYNGKVKNLICAGRCTSVDQRLWDVMRVIPCCVITGQAAGTASALTDDFSTLDIKKLQKVLVDNGVKLHEFDL